MKLTREFYIPKGAQKITMIDGGAVFYLYKNEKGAPCAMCFVGRAAKPTWRYRFPDDTAREKKIRAQICSTQEAAKRRAEYRAERNKPHNMEKGLILYTSWGYDQTNTEFYEVVDVPSPCFVLLQQIGAPYSNGPAGNMSAHVMPNPENKIGKPLRRKVSMLGGRPSVSIDDVVTAWVWDGKERYSSWYA